MVYIRLKERRVCLLVELGFRQKNTVFVLVTECRTSSLSSWGYWNVCGNKVTGLHVCYGLGEDIRACPSEHSVWDASGVWSVRPVATNLSVLAQLLNLVHTASQTHSWWVVDSTFFSKLLWTEFLDKAKWVWSSISKNWHLQVWDYGSTRKELSAHSG